MPSKKFDPELDLYVPTSPRSRQALFGPPEPEVELPPLPPGAPPIVINNYVGQQAPTAPASPQRPVQGIMPRPWWVGKHGFGWTLFLLALAAGAVWGVIKLFQIGVL